MIPPSGDHVTEVAQTSTPNAPATAAASPGIKADLRLVAYWITLGAAAGGIGGFLVGGIGGRLAMLLLRFTSPDYVRGIRTDDGFVIGRFDLVDTLQFVLLTTVMGTLVGLIIVLGRPFFPARWPIAWTFAGAIVGGALFIHTNGIDFNILEPTWLAVGLFVLIPAAGAGLIAVLVELLHRFWWRRRGPTIVVGLPGLAAFAFPPVALGALLVGAVFLAGMRRPSTRALHTWLPSRIAAIAVFAGVVCFSAIKLTRDIAELT